MLGSSIRQVSKVLNISWPNGTNTNLWRKHLGLHPPPKKKHHRPKMTESRFLRWWLTPFMHFRGVGSQCLMSWTCGIGKTGTLATKTHGKKLVFTGPEGRLLLLFLLLGWWVGGVFSRDSSLWRWGPIIQWCTWRSTNRKIFIHKRFVRSVFFFHQSLQATFIQWHVYDISIQWGSDISVPGCQSPPGLSHFLSSGDPKPQPYFVTIACWEGQVASKSVHDSHESWVISHELW